MLYLAICQSCRHPFSLTQYVDVADCPKPRCDGIAIVGNGSSASVFDGLHEAFPHIATREQRREIRKLLQQMAASEITAEEAVQRAEFSPQTIELLKFLIAQGLSAFGIVIALLAYLQSAAWREEDQRERELDRQAEIEMHQAVLEDLSQLHLDQATLEARLNRVEEAQLVEEEEVQPPHPRRSQRPRRAENASGPKPRSPGRPSTRRTKKGS